MRRTTKITSLLVAGCLALGAAACGSEEPSVVASSPSSDGMSEGMDSGDDDHGSFTFGEPADAADADRSIEIEAVDIAFDPTSIEVGLGETITFVITNSGASVHEFTLGTSSVQDEHEEEMQDMAGGMMMADEPNAIAIAAGETKEITWSFTQAGEVLYGCHQPSHYDAGMVGTITVTG
ncbi:MAG: putative cupredoxin-like copper-binding protein [Glaciecola sp.]|jgi:uncharacterized cupredoxin-like copper-binding protein